MKFYSGQKLAFVMHLKKMILFVTCFLKMWFSQAQSVTIKWLVPEENSLNQILYSDLPVLNAKVEVNATTRLNPLQIKVYRNNVFYSENGEKLGSQPLSGSAIGKFEMALKLNLREGMNEFYVEVADSSHKYIGKTLRIN